MVKAKKTSTPALKKNPWLVPKGAKLIHESTSKLGFETAVTSQRSMMMMMKFTNTLLPPRTPCSTGGNGEFHHHAMLRDNSPDIGCASKSGHETSLFLFAPR